MTPPNKLLKQFASGPFFIKRRQSPALPSVR
jgi:hypothetical protein